jgi:hypothetical protein
MMFWSEFEATDPRFTKKSEYGARLTSINGVYQFKKMTAAFGPCGVGWGFDVMTERFDSTGPLYARVWDQGANKAVMKYADETGLPMVIGDGKLHTLTLKIWYSPLGPRPSVEHVSPGTASWVEAEEYERPRYEVEGIGHTPYLFMGQKDLFPNCDEEYYKKSLTDALTNAMAKLGMAADVRMGLFDDNDYMRELQDDFAIDAAEDRDAEIARQRHEFEDWFTKHLDLIETCSTIRELEILYKGGRPRVERSGTDDQKKEHYDSKNSQIRALNKEVKDGDKK